MLTRRNLFAKVVEKLFELPIVDSIRPSKRSILKIYTMFSPETERDVL